jgi:ankyrin repeat protein
MMIIEEGEEEEQEDKEEDFITYDKNAVVDYDYDDVTRSQAQPLIGHCPTVLHLVQAVDSMGNTPLHYASANGYVDIIRVMAESLRKNDSSST